MRWTKPKKSKLKWHKWFAWYPICIAKHIDGSREYAWLEYVWIRTVATNGVIRGWEIKKYE